MNLFNRNKQPSAGAGLAPGATTASSLVPTPGAPIALLVGSIAGCSAKDAHSYARGLAEATLTAPAMAFIRIFFDKPNARYVYEVHEGGPGLSIMEKVLDALANGQEVRIALTNGAQVAISEAHGEIFSLTYPPVAEELLPGGDVPAVPQVPAAQILAYTGTHKLAPLIAERKSLVPWGVMALVASGGLLVLTGGVWVAAKSNILEGDFLIAQIKSGYVAQVADNPIVQLDKVRANAEREGKVLHKLEKGPKGWTHELK